MSKYLNHEPKEKLNEYTFMATTCKYCGCNMFYDRYLKKEVPQFSVSCLTYDEKIIKDIIE